jgi:Meckel syndrome type 1 protein
MARFPLLPAAAAAAFALAGCASDAGEFPSLAQRPAERAFAAEQMAPPKVRPALPDDPAVAQRTSAFVAAAREAEIGFGRAYDTAAAAVARAGPAGSDSWVVAQEGVSRAIAAQAPLTRLLGEMDDYAAARSRQTPISPGDIGRLDTTSAEVHRLADAQTARIRRLETALAR